MSFLKKFGLMLSALLLCVGISAVSAYAQPGRARYEGNNGKHKGWDKGKHYGWYKNKNWNRRNDRLSRRNARAYNRGRLSAAEYRRLERSRTRLYRSVNRANRNGSINNRERRRLTTRYTTYNRRYRRAVRN